LKNYLVWVAFSLPVIALVGGIIGLVGGYMLRYVIIYGGTRLMFNVNDTLVAPPPENYEIKSIESSYQTYQKA
jgi:hypothetical protein